MESVIYRIQHPTGSNHMFHKIVLLLLGCTIITACTHQKLDSSLHRLKGQHIDVAVRYLGIPDDKLTIDQREVFIWGRRYVPDNRPFGTFGGYNSSTGVFGGVGIVFGSGGSPYRDTYRYYCEIKAMTDEKNIIETITYESNAGDCSRFNQAMERLEQDNIGNGEIGGS